jgi:hypothetical protein
LPKQSDLSFAIVFARQGIGIKWCAYDAKQNRAIDIEQRDDPHLRGRLLQPATQKGFFADSIPSRGQYPKLGELSDVGGQIR